MSDHKQLLDPIGTLCKLVSLSFYDTNTKISIHNHVITFLEPTKLQWLVRSCNLESRENISELYYVISELILWFLVNDTNNNDSNNSNNSKIRQSDEIKRMIEYLCIALKKLQGSTYKFGNVTLALQYYILLLKFALENKFDIIMLPEHLRDKAKFNDNLLDLDKFKNLWELKDIKRICELYDNCFNLLDDHEDLNKQDLIQSYLKSIDSILKITDEKFQKLIKNSNNG